MAIFAAQVRVSIVDVVVVAAVVDTKLFKTGLFLVKTYARPLRTIVEMYLPPTFPSLSHTHIHIVFD